MLDLVNSKMAAYQGKIEGRQLTEYEKKILE